MHPIEFPALGDLWLVDALLALEASLGPLHTPHRAQFLEGVFHVSGHGGGDRDGFLRHRVPESQQLRVQGLAVDEGAGFPVDLIPQEGKAAIRELDSDLVASSRFQLHFHDRITWQSVHHAEVGDGMLGALGLFLPGMHHRHLQALGVLHQLTRERTRVFRKLSHQDGLVDPVEMVPLEQRLEAMEGFCSLGEDQHPGGEAVR